MAITPQPGYQVDPSNPNGVIPIGQSPTLSVGSQSPGGTQSQSSPLAMPGSYQAIQQSTQAPSQTYGAVNNVNTATPSPQTTNVQPAVSAPPQQPTYVVQKGDTLSNIAAQNNVSLPDLMKLNPNITDPNKINTGQQINLNGQPQSLSNKYNTALDNVKGTAPQNQGDAQSAINGLLPGDNSQNNAGSDQAKQITSQLQNDPAIAQLMADQQQYLSTENQQQSLQQEYDSLMQSSGVQGLNTQLINMKSVMDGTEDDIRNEITKAGGFATESQVLAMTSARNKVMVQNYNNLLQTRDSLVNQINTSMGFAEKDRAQATALAEEKLNYDQQLVTYEQKMQDNAKSAYQKIVDTPGYGYKALLQSAGGDPKTISLIEKTLGLPPGSLNQLATMPEDVKTQVVKLDNGSTMLINSQTGQTIRNLGGATLPGGVSTSDPYVQAHVSSILNGNETMQQVPSNLRNAVALAMANAPKDQYSPLAASRFSTASNKIVSNFIQLPQYQLTANGLPYLQRIDAAMKTPGSISDQDLLDSLTKLNTAGNAISDAQVKLITGGKSFSDMASVFSNKFSTGGVLSDTQRQQIQSIAKAIFANYQKGYAPVYSQATQQLSDAGIPRAFWTIPDLNNLSAQINDQSAPINGSNVTLPPDIDSALAKSATINEGTKTVYIPRATWSTFGASMDLVLEALKSRGYQLLIN